MPGEPDPLYVKARRVLLDALEALGPHSDAVILIGAQAIYLEVGETDLPIAPFTSDGDLAAGGATPRTLTSVAADVGKADCIRPKGPPL